MFVRATAEIAELIVAGVSVAGIAAREDPTAKWSRPEMAPQRLEKIESAPGNGMGSEASNPQDVVHGRAAHRALRLTEGEGLGGSYKVAEKGAERLEVVRCKTEIGAWAGRGKSLTRSEARHSK